MPPRNRTRSPARTAAKVGSSPLRRSDAAGRRPVAVVGIGASLGGMEAFAALLTALPPNTGLAFVFVQPGVPARPSTLAPLPGRATAMPVVEVTDPSATVIQADHVYVAPPGHVMVVSEGALHRAQIQGMPHRGVDRLFNSLAEDQGSRAIGVILSGPATDGMLGLEAIKAAGGITFAQDASAQHERMPRGAISGGCADFVLPLQQIATEITALGAHLRGSCSGDESAAPQADEFGQVLAILRQNSGIDFSHYKSNMLHPGIRRRMALRRVPTVAEYASVLGADAAEREALHEDILIGVTRFFRDPEAFEALQQQVFPSLFAGRSRSDALKVWVLGCATGEEAYSLAIALKEYATAINSVAPIVIYATDINNTAVEKARGGFYPRTIAMDISRERLRRFFVKTDGGYRIAKSIRDMCVFARHDVLTDPPFARMDLISCRNVLIYMKPVLQKKILAMLHYALQPRGCLFLGSTDSLETIRDAFAAQDLGHPIFRKNVTPTPTPTPAARTDRDTPRPCVTSRGDERSEAQRDAELHARDEQISRLTQELAATREYLQSVIERQETANEELQSANEEVQAANEELQSINVELETSREEIQSSNEELTRVNSDLNNLLAGVPMAIVMVWRDLRIRRFTPLAEKLFNLLARDVGRPLSDIKPKLDVGNLLQILSDVIASGSVREMEVRDASGHWFQLRVRPYTKSGNQVDGAIIMLVDIDALRRNQEAVARQAELLEHTSDAIFVHDSEGVIQYWNQGAERLYGISRTEACGKHREQILDVDPAEAEMAREVVARGEPWRGEVKLRKFNGSPAVVTTHQVAFREGGRHLILETHHDVTEQKELEQRLQQRVRDLARADKSKNEFLSMLAHELRNPLAPLRNAVQILKKAPAEAELSARTRDLMERQITNMARIVDDLLDAARLSRGHIGLHLQDLDLQTLLGRSIEAVNAALDARRHRLTVLMPPSPVMVSGDSTRLEQVFTNLLNNAVKYTDAGGAIVVTLTVSDSPGRRPEAVVRVRDNGVGIAPDMLPRVFDLFAQADLSTARTQGGLGIGLNIVHRIVELHQGQVSAQSAGLQRGSEFVVCLPVLQQYDRVGPKADVPAANAVSAPTPQPAWRGDIRVLVVDDNPDIAQSTATLLRLHGYTVRLDMDGEHALATARLFVPHVILLDLGLPGLDGFAVARAIRTSAELREVMLVAVSGYGGAEDRAKAKTAGFDHHFVKPLDVEEFQATVMAHWNEARQANRLAVNAASPGH